MADPEQRERESQESPVDKFHERRDEERIEREHIAEESSDEFLDRDPDEDE